MDEFEGQVRVHHLLPGLRVVDARACAHRWVVFHETYDFCLVTEVAASPVFWRYNRRIYTVDAEHVMMAMQPGELHANVERTAHGNFIVVQVTEDLMQEVARGLGWSSTLLDIPHPHPATTDWTLRAALERVHRSLCPSLFAKQNQCQCSRSPGVHAEDLVFLVEAFLGGCAAGSRPEPPPKGMPAAVRRASEYLIANYRNGYDLKELSRASGADQWSVLRQFRDVYGISPHTLQLHVLVSKTCEALVRSPRMPLETLAREVGWPGKLDAKKADTLIKHFRRTWGLTPDRFRRPLRGFDSGDWTLRANEVLQAALVRRRRSR
jgi:AraC-like DNA-binding protein